MRLACVLDHILVDHVTGEKVQEYVQDEGEVDGRFDPDHGPTSIVVEAETERGHEGNVPLPSTRQRIWLVSLKIPPREEEGRCVQDPP